MNAKMLILDILNYPVFIQVLLKVAHKWLHKKEREQCIKLDLKLHETDGAKDKYIKLLKN